ncbi:terminase small subunit [Acinetobacter baumannii]|uniref:terminase small subunit n=1 Tax=Acinetobacter calcoaceticus/baumannii complex TaxID=909768 RepID=UPI00112B1E63|nr:terminase small subunit [Acinetobacter baumannii]MBO0669048.1 terminase small subunit [Acinetobacter baumannii]MCW1488892.1 terminase small subunit [Acinetobacter baumannii]MDN8336095.1 terminase small subunit [Acinetobacter baumannii]MDP8557637.1 terminase small subunit [Acinetobacter baumannii]MDZ5526218.1 terminase small subunit [Acinetobacter baumannii]
MALTEKKKAFALAKRNGKDNKEAAILAGCPEKTASAAGARLAKDPDVIAYLERLEKATPEQVVKHDVKPLTTNTTIQAAKNLADPLEFLESVYSDPVEDMALRVRAAQAALPYVHGKVAEKGKKETKAETAREGSKSGKFATLDNQLMS